MNLTTTRIINRRRRRHYNIAISWSARSLLLLFCSAVAILLLPIPGIGSGGRQRSLYWWVEAKTTVQINQGGTNNNQNNNKNGKEIIAKNHVVDLTARNFARQMGASNVVWLVEFYSPRCSHCVEFAPTYKEMAKHYHEEADSTDEQDKPKTKKKKKIIKVAKVNGEVEQALLSRFAIAAYPTFFVIDGWSVYEFNNARSKVNLMKYVEGEYKTDGTLVPFYSSPMGPMGLVQGTVIATGYSVADLLTWMQTSWGISPVLSAMVLFGSFFISIFIAIVAMAIFLPASAGARPKRD